MNDTAAIATFGLTRDFPGVRAVDRLTLEVPGRSIFGFLGPNGSGKTTTIRLLLGLLAPTSGEAAVLGCDVRRQPDAVRSRCGALLEHDGLYERLTAADNLDLAGRIWHMSRAERDGRTRELLSQLALFDRRDEPVRNWSRGMKRKLAVARALYHRPSLVFLDEPTSGLDPVAAAALVEDLRRLVEHGGLTVFLTTHNLAEAEKLCGRLAVIREGRLVAQGSPDELRGMAGGRRVDIACSAVPESARRALEAMPGVRSARPSAHGLEVVLEAGAAAAPLVRYLVGRGVEIEEVRKGAPSLEAAFLALVDNREGEAAP